MVFNKTSVFHKIKKDISTLGMGGNIYKQILENLKEFKFLFKIDLDPLLFMFTLTLK